MRYFFIFAILFCTITKLTAQSKVTEYCEIATFRKSDTKVKAWLVIGEVDSLFSSVDSSGVHSLQKIHSLETTPDILNYMTRLGWSISFVATMPAHTYFYFKKEFEK
jgi:hypothetical protein